MFWVYTEQVAWLSPQMPQLRRVMKRASRGSLPCMNPLYPRKIDEVLWHSTIRFWAKSILVWMPRLPTILVVGAQAMANRAAAPGCGDVTAQSPRPDRTDPAPRPAG